MLPSYFLALSSSKKNMKKRKKKKNASQILKVKLCDSGGGDSLLYILAVRIIRILLVSEVKLLQLYIYIGLV